MDSKYVDNRACIQVLSCFYAQPSLLEDEHFSFTKEDFVSPLHQVIFGAMFNLGVTFGDTHFNATTIDNYLRNKKESYAIFQANNGMEWLNRAYKSADVKNYVYYATRVKKFSLLRAYDKAGMDVSFVMDMDNLDDVQKKEEQESTFDSMTIAGLVDLVENKVVRVKDIVANIDNGDTFHAGEHADELLDEVLNGTQLGYPIYDRIYNRVIMGARQSKFYIRSSNSGGGKSRSAMADACYLACNKIYENNTWQDVGETIPTLFISVELDESELEHLAWSFIANVPSDHIDLNQFEVGEIDRVREAIKVEKESKLIFKFLPDYTIKDITNTIKKEIREHNIAVIFFDYIASSATIMNELTHAAGGVKIQEFQVIYMISDMLKTICEQYGVTIFTSTQTNASAKYDKVPDQNVLAGAKSVINRADVGSVLLDCQPSDYEDIEGILGRFPVRPNMKLSVFKNRAGKWNRIILWLAADKGTCRFKTVGCTDYNFNWIPLEDICPEIRVNEFDIVRDDDEDEDVAIMDDDNESDFMF